MAKTSRTTRSPGSGGRRHFAHHKLKVFPSDGGIVPAGIEAFHGRGFFASQPHRVGQFLARERRVVVEQHFGIAHLFARGQIDGVLNGDARFSRLRVGAVVVDVHALRERLVGHRPLGKDLDRVLLDRRVRRRRAAIPARATGPDDGGGRTIFAPAGHVAVRFLVLLEEAEQVGPLLGGQVRWDEVGIGRTGPARAGNEEYQGQKRYRNRASVHPRAVGGVRDRYGPIGRTRPAGVKRIMANRELPAKVAQAVRPISLFLSASQ